MKSILASIIILTVAGSLVSCKKDDYKVDGGVHDPKVNMTTYDFLKSKPQFSSLVRFIDRAGLKETVNGKITFFACTNYSVDDFVKARRQMREDELQNENIIYTLDSVPLQVVSDSLKMYMYNGDLGRDKLTLDGKFYDNLLGPIPNESFYIKMRRDYSRYTSYVNYVDYVNFTKVIGTRDATDPNPGNIPESQQDKSYDCQTSGIITTTGVIHVLSDNHRFAFNARVLR